MGWMFLTKPISPPPTKWGRRLTNLGIFIEGTLFFLLLLTFSIFTIIGLYVSIGWAFK